jgi:hypothetical protein
MPIAVSKMELPSWLPWATTACLAALVACLGELWIIEKARSELLREEGMLANAALKAMENQLEAERIVNRRELTGLRAAAGRQRELQVAFLLRPDGSAAHAPRPFFGVVAWDPAGKQGLLRLSGPPAQDPGRDYQLWLEGPGSGNPANCGVFHAPPSDDCAGTAIEIAGPIALGCRLLLVEVKKGGASTLEEAEAGGSIVLASLPFGENITK